jgi:hypothetical protein
MTTSGTYNYAPDAGSVSIKAFARCGIRRTEITTEHLADALAEMNFMQADWSASGVNLWQVDLQSVPLVQGQITYASSASTMFMLDAWISVQSGAATTDRLIFPLSRSDYASLANKRMQGAPTSFWFDRLVNPVIYLWPVPDQTGYYTLNYYRAIQLQDSVLSNGTQPNIVYRYLDAYMSDLARRLSLVYAPERYQLLAQEAARARQTAISSDTENVPVKVWPTIEGYFR